MLPASSGLTTVGKLSSTPVLIDASIIRRIARPIRQTERPARSPASASVFTRATLEANVVATTMPDASRTSVSISGPTVASDRPACAENTLVESQISALMPGFATSAQSARSNGSPTSGVSSILKSPECTNRPCGASMTSPELSGIECEIGTNPTLNGPASTTSGQGDTVRTVSGDSSRSFILSRAIWAVKARA